MSCLISIAVKSFSLSARARPSTFLLGRLNIGPNRTTCFIRPESVPYLKTMRTCCTKFPMLTGPSPSAFLSRESLKIFRNEVFHEPVFAEVHYEIVRGRLVVLSVPRRDLARRQLPVFRLQKFIAEFRDGEPFGLRSRRPASQQIVLLIQPLLKCRFTLGIVYFLGEVAKLPRTFLTHQPLALWQKRGKSTRGLSGFSFRLRITDWIPFRSSGVKGAYAVSR